MLPLSANLSLLFRDLPIPDRFAAAKDAGFSDVETWWPFATATPTDSEVDEFLAGLAASGLKLRGLNFYAGDMAAGVRGIASWPDATDDFRANVAVVERIARKTGCRHFNVLYGQRRSEFSPEEQDACATENLAFAAHALAPLDGVILLEALTHPDNGDYPLLTLADADAVRERVERVSPDGTVALLFDTFHLAGNGADLVAEIPRYAAHIGHVQLADFPGRGDPGTGSIDFPAVVRALENAGYEGYLAGEFIPAGAVSASAIAKSLEA